MFALKKMTKEMHDEVLAMVEQFYHSDAVCIRFLRSGWSRPLRTQ